MREETLEGTRFAFRDGDFALELTLGVPGGHQAANAALALACVRRAGVLGDEALARAAPAAFARPELPARIELVSRAPWIVIDGAHTAASARALAGVIGRIPRRRTELVVSVSAGKALREICEALAPLADARHGDARRARALAHARGGGRRVPRRRAGARAAHRPEPASRAARRARGHRPDDLLCATGSFYLAGIARSILRE